MTAAPLITKPPSKSSIDDLFKLEMADLLKLKVSSGGGAREEEESGWYLDRKPSNYGMSDTPTFNVSETRPPTLKSFSDMPTSSKTEQVGGGTSLDVGEVGVVLDLSPDVSDTSSNMDICNTDSETGGVSESGFGVGMSGSGASAVGVSGGVASAVGVSESGFGGVGVSGGVASPVTSETKESDLEFLQSCFPDTSHSVLKTLYDKSNNNLSATVDLVLHIPQPSYDPSYTLELLDEEEDEWMEFEPIRSTSTGAHELEGTSIEGGGDDIIFIEPETKEEEEKMEGEPTETREGSSEVEYDIMKDLGLTKDEYEKALGVQLKIENEKEKKKGKGKSREREGGDPNATKAKKGIGTNNTGTGIKLGDNIGGTKPGASEPGPSESGPSSSAVEGGEKGGSWDDANLMLRLTPSLANQLQSMFGRVPSHMLKGKEERSLDFLIVCTEFNEGSLKHLIEVTHKLIAPVLIASMLIIVQLKLNQN